jgi:hypothetical protein
MHEQPQLIDEAAAQEGLHKRDAAHGRDVPAVRLLELGQLGPRPLWPAVRAGLRLLAPAARRP